MDPNPWSWMSGSIRKGIGWKGKDGSARIGISFPGFKSVDFSELNNGSPERRPHLKCQTFNGFKLEENETEDQEVGSQDGVVGSKDGVVDVRYEKYWVGWERVYLGIVCILILFDLFLSIFNKTKNKSDLLSRSCITHMSF